MVVLVHLLIIQELEEEVVQVQQVGMVHQVLVEMVV
jgi:hypothetical protein